MTAVVVLLEIPIRPDAEGVDEVLREDLPHTASFTGNESTAVITDAARPNTLFLLTRWATMEAYDAYSEWRRSPGGVTRMSEIASAAPIVRRFNTYLEF